MAPSPSIENGGLGMSRTVYVGLDLGGTFHQVRVADADGRRMGKSFRIVRGRAGVAALLENIRALGSEELTPVFAVEATRNYWQEIVHPLLRDGYRVHLVSPNKSASLRAFYHRHTKTDDIDAEASARLPLVDPGLRVRQWVSKEVEATLRHVRLAWRLRGHIAARKKRIFDRTAMVYPGYESVFRNRYCSASLTFIAGYLDPSRARRLGAKRLARLLDREGRGKVTTAQIERLWKVIDNAPELEVDYDELQFAVRQDLELLAAEQRVRDELRQRVVELHSRIDPACRLTAVPGFGDFLGAAITAFILAAAPWGSSSELVALAGLSPRKRSSAGRDVASLPMTKHGDPVFRSCLYFAAQVARQYDPECQAFYQRLRARGKHHNVASCALAAKLLRRCAAILRDDREYEIRGLAEIHQLQRQEGKTVRASVFEVAQRLRDGSGSIPPRAQRYGDRPGAATGSGPRPSHGRRSAASTEAHLGLATQAPDGPVHAAGG